MGGNTPDPRGRKGTATPVTGGISAWTANGESAKLGTGQYSTVARDLEYTLPYLAGVGKAKYCRYSRTVGMYLRTLELVGCAGTCMHQVQENQKYTGEWQAPIAGNHS